MESAKTFEIKVGTFILVGVAILFIIVFSIGDINISKAGYRITITFNFASGLGPSAPVRLAGVGIGNVQGIKIIYNEKDKKSHAEVTAWVEADTKIEDDATVTINTLGLLGEKYLEIFPGTPGKPFMKAGDTIAGKDPVVMEKLTENMVNISDSVSVIIERLKNGEGAIGKLLTEDVVYNDVKSITGDVKNTTGDFKIMANDLKATAANFKAFSEDIKAHPWKILARPRGE